jgi:hypothetical protein
MHYIIYTCICLLFVLLDCMYAQLHLCWFVWMLFTVLYIGLLCSGSIYICVFSSFYFLIFLFFASFFFYFSSYSFSSFPNSSWKSGRNWSGRCMYGSDPLSVSLMDVRHQFHLKRISIFFFFFFLIKVLLLILLHFFFPLFSILFIFFFVLTKISKV